MTQISLPEQRRFIAIAEEGRGLILASEAMPGVAAGEVLIKVCAAGVNRGDLLQRRGLYPPPADASPILGLEVSGEIVALGEGVSQWQLGDRVCALTHGAGYCDYTTVPASQCLPVPADMPLADAAALPEAMLTVWHNVFQRARLQPGESLLVHGGASGIGTTAIAVASALGATVYTTAGSDEKCRRCEALGAMRAVNYKTEDFVEVFKAATDGRGVDVILDMVGGDYIQKNMELAAVEGRIVSIAFIGGAKTQTNWGPMLVKRLTLSGSTLRPQSFAQKAQMIDELRERVWPLLESGRLRPVIDSRYPLERAEEAHARMGSGEHMGKILLTL